MYLYIKIGYSKFGLHDAFKNLTVEHKSKAINLTPQFGM